MCSPVASFSASCTASIICCSVICLNLLLNSIFASAVSTRLTASKLVLLLLASIVCTASWCSVGLSKSSNCCLFIFFVFFVIGLLPLYIVQFLCQFCYFFIFFAFVPRGTFASAFAWLFAVVPFLQFNVVDLCFFCSCAYISGPLYYCPAGEAPPEAAVTALAFAIRFDICNCLLSFSYCICVQFFSSFP
jgi:hypothetical protein